MSVLKVSGMAIGDEISTIEIGTGNIIIIVDDHASVAITFIDRDDAIKIIDHLSEVFDIGHHEAGML